MASHQVIDLDDVLHKSGAQKHRHPERNLAGNGDGDGASRKDRRSSKSAKALRAAAERWGKKQGSVLSFHNLRWD